MWLFRFLFFFFHPDDPDCGPRGSAYAEGHFGYILGGGICGTLARGTSLQTSCAMNLVELFRYLPNCCALELLRLLQNILMLYDNYYCIE